MKTLQTIFEEAKYKVDFDNRNYSVKSINTVLKNSKIEIEIVENGFIKTTNKGFKWNVKITLPTSAGVLAYRWKAIIEPYQILKCLAAFLKSDDVKKEINSKVTTPHQCGKCNGTGFIPAFAHYAEGVCFDCMGIGYVGVLSVKDVQSQSNYVKTGRGYINQFYISDEFSKAFPKDVKTIKPIRHINHPTAIEYLGKKGDFYYIYAPIAQRNDWYEIPATNIEKFNIEFKKIFYIDLLT